MDRLCLSALRPFPEGLQEVRTMLQGREIASSRLLLQGPPHTFVGKHWKAMLTQYLKRITGKHLTRKRPLPK